MTNTQIGLFRHGQTDWNISFLLQGTTDIPMNSTGMEQVRSAAQALKNERWDLILTSPLSRAKASAEIIAAALRHSEVIEEPLLLERSFGEAEGFSHDQWRAKYSNLDEIPGGESRQELHARSEKLLETILKRHSGAKVLAVSHGALIRNLLAIGSNNDLPRPGERLGNASLNVLKHELDSWRVARYELDPLKPGS